MRHKLILILLLTAAFATPYRATAEESLQRSLYKVAADARAGTLAIEIWEDFSTATTIPVRVVGTGFLVDEEGHFVTAAHVATALPDKPSASRKACVLVYQQNGGGTCLDIKILEIDNDHDLALGKIIGFFTTGPGRPRNISPFPPEARHAFASFALDATPKVGEMIALSGFGLAVIHPTLKLGLISSTDYIAMPNQALPSGLKYNGAGELLQVSVSGNHGDSGGPVISLETGKVVGVLSRILPAPLAIGGNNVLEPGTFSMSGVFLVAPAKWVQALLDRNSVKAVGISQGKLNIW